MHNSPQQGLSCRAVAMKSQGEHEDTNWNHGHTLGGSRRSASPHERPHQTTRHALWPGPSPPHARRPRLLGELSHVPPGGPWCPIAVRGTRCACTWGCPHARPGVQVRGTHNYWINLTVRPVTPLACPGSAPTSPRKVARKGRAGPARRLSRRCTSFLEHGHFHR